MELMFSGSTQIEQLCQIISTSDDSVVENGEMFTLSLTSSESLITIPISSVTVHITDDDGKYNRRYLFDKINFKSQPFVLPNINPCLFVAEVVLQFTQEVYEISESAEVIQACVVIAPGYIIDRNIPFTIESTLSSNTTAEGNPYVYYCCF